jgi:hypothetical protein
MEGLSLRNTQGRRLNKILKTETTKTEAHRRMVSSGMLRREDLKSYGSTSVLKHAV